MHKKAFKNEVLQMFRNSLGFAPNDVSPTHDSKSFSYVMKLQTRIDGPWRDDKEVEYIPRCYRIEYDRLYPYQKAIFDSKDAVGDNRYINFVYCASGNIGKTTISHMMDAKGFGHIIPLFNDGENIIQFFCGWMSSRKIREPRVVFVDIPRSMKQIKMTGI